jgi:hypothetical protein
MSIRRSVLAGAAVLVVVALSLPACGGGDGETGGTLDGVGRIPGNDFVGVATLPPDIAADVSIPEIDGAVLGSVAKGNRLLMIGDSILSSIAKRYGNEACNLLVPQGWNVALEAEAGQFVEFGLDVLDKRWNEGWDGVVIELGTNYAGSKDHYRETAEAGQRGRRRTRRALPERQPARLGSHLEVTRSAERRPHPPHAEGTRRSCHGDRACGGNRAHVSR